MLYLTLLLTILYTPYPILKLYNTYVKEISKKDKDNYLYLLDMLSKLSIDTSISIKSKLKTHNINTWSEKLTRHFYIYSTIGVK